MIYTCAAIFDCEKLTEACTIWSLHTCSFCDISACLSGFRPGNNPVTLPMMQEGSRRQLICTEMFQTMLLLNPAVEQWCIFR